MGDRVLAWVDKHGTRLLCGELLTAKLHCMGRQGQPGGGASHSLKNADRHGPLQGVSYGRIGLLRLIGLLWLGTQGKAALHRDPP